MIAGLRWMPIAVASSSVFGTCGSGGSGSRLSGGGADGGEVGLARDLERALARRRACEREAARRDSLWLTSVRVTSPTSKRLLGGAQRLVQALDVVAGEADELLVAAHVDIGLDRVEEHLLLDVLQVGAAGGDRCCAPTRPPPWSGRCRR